MSEQYKVFDVDFYELQMQLEQHAVNGYTLHTIIPGHGAHIKVIMVKRVPVKPSGPR